MVHPIQQISICTANQIQSQKLKIRRKLEFRARRMACASTHSGSDVWATFLKRLHPSPSKRIARIRLHTAPALNSNAANLTLEDIDYSTLSAPFGSYTTRENFEDVALAVWYYFGPDLKLKTRAELEGRTGFMTAKEKEKFNADASDVSSDHVSDDEDSSYDFGDEWPGQMVSTRTQAHTSGSKEPMSVEEAIMVQHKYFSGEKVDSHAFFRSIQKYGRITVDKLVRLFDETDEETLSEQTSIGSSEKRKRVCDGVVGQVEKRSRLDDEVIVIEDDTDVEICGSARQEKRRRGCDGVARRVEKKLKLDHDVIVIDDDAAISISSVTGSDTDAFGSARQEKKKRGCAGAAGQVEKRSELDNDVIVIEDDTATSGSSVDTEAQRMIDSIIANGEQNTDSESDVDAWLAGLLD